MKKKLTLAMMVITIIEAVCMFIPGIVELGSKDMNAFAGFRGENAGIANTFSKITLFLLLLQFLHKCKFAILQNFLVQVYHKFFATNFTIFVLQPAKAFAKFG